MTSFSLKPVIFTCLGTAVVAALLVAGATLVSPSASPAVNAEATASREAPGLPAVVPPVIAAGCWEVSGTDGTQLEATWFAECQGVSNPELGPQPWLTQPLRLPARAAGTPPRADAVTSAVLSRDLAQTGQGALLYLPISANSGYYVAGWATRSSHEDRSVDGDKEVVTVARRGVVIGLYGAQPPSVATPGGRVYISEDFSPSGIRQRRRQHQEAPREPLLDRTSDEDPIEEGA